jgi:hypothetical protein
MTTAPPACFRGYFALRAKPPANLVMPAGRLHLVIEHLDLADHLFAFQGRS